MLEQVGKFLKLNSFSINPPLKYLNRNQISFHGVDIFGQLFYTHLIIALVSWQSCGYFR
jgi:hypothetical protein